MSSADREKKSRADPPPQGRNVSPIPMRRATPMHNPFYARKKPSTYCKIMLRHLAQLLIQIPQRASNSSPLTLALPLLSLLLRCRLLQASGDNKSRDATRNQTGAKLIGIRRIGLPRLGYAAAAAEYRRRNAYALPAVSTMTNRNSREKKIGRLKNKRLLG